MGNTTLDDYWLAVHYYPSPFSFVQLGNAGNASKTVSCWLVGVGWISEGMEKREFGLVVLLVCLFLIFYLFPSAAWWTTGCINRRYLRQLVFWIPTYMRSPVQASLQTKQVQILTLLFALSSPDGMRW